MEILSELGCLATARLSHHNDHIIVSDQMKQLLSDSKHRQVFSLLFDGLLTTEIGLATILINLKIEILIIDRKIHTYLHVVCKLLTLFEVCSIIKVLILRVICLLNTKNISHFRPRQLPLLLLSLLLLGLVPVYPDQPGPLLGHGGHVAGAVLDGNDGLRLLSEHNPDQ